MSACAPKRWWRISRACLRGMRLGILLLTFFLVVLLTWVNTIGLPDFLKRPLIAQLHARGLDLQFSRLRWRWNRGLVADDVRIGPAQQEDNSPQFSTRLLEVKVNHHALARFKLQIDSVTLRGGELVWPLAEPDHPSASLAVTNIQTQLRFLPGDQWALDNFTADFRGAQLLVSGTLTNASALRNWSILHARAEKQPALLRQRLRQLSETFDQIKFVEPPTLTVVINGDARDVRTFNGVLMLDAQHAITPWGEMSKGTLSVRLIPPAGTNSLPTVKCQLKTDEVKFELHPAPTRTLAGDTRNFKLDLDAAVDEQQTNLIRARLEMSADHFTIPWVQATDAHFAAHWTHSLTNAIPIEETVDLSLTDARTKWGSAGQLQLNASLSMAETNGPAQADANWGWWAKLEPYLANWNCRVQDIHAGDFESKEVRCGGNWRAPELTITNLHTEMYQGRFDADAGLNVASRKAHFACTSDFDAQKAYPLLTPGAREWLDHQEFAWEKPPLLHGSGSVILPAWTNAHPDWRGEVQPTLSLAGDFQVGAASYRKIPVTSAHSHIYYTNKVWNLPDLVAYRPEGKVELAHVSDDYTKDYYFRVRSTADVKIVRHLLPTNAQRGLDEFVFTQPPLIDAEIWGRWHAHNRIGFKGQVTLTNFTFRGASAKDLHTFFEYTNRFLELKDARVERGTEYLSASSMGIDISGKRAFLTNGFSTMEPMVVLRVIGPKVARDMEPYHFLKAPTIEAQGVIPLSNDTDVADLHFKVDGGPFEWLKFHLPRISGSVDWKGDRLTLHEMQAAFYEGKLTGSAGFVFTPHGGANFHFDTIVTGVNLHSLMSDLVTSTNRLEGTLNGHLEITHASTEDPRSWFGKGEADLRDGLIWDIPIFGILTPVLDAISPGLGKTRASEASGHFTITNSVIRSDDLVINSPTIRLFYKGTVNFERQVDATVSAEVGRNTPVVGPVVAMISSPFGKLFETRVTGNLEDPKREPVVFFIRWLNPFNWLRMFKEQLLPEKSANNPNYPPPP